MKKNEVKVGGTYLAKVTDKVVPVRLDAEHPRGGWQATNLTTKKQIRIKSAQRLRSTVSSGTTTEPKDAGHEGKAEDIVVVIEAKGGSKAKTDAAATPKDAKAVKTARQPKAPKEGKKLSLINAAAQVLADANEPMNVKQMLERVVELGLWTPGNGKTPASTLYAAILRETSTKGDASRFRKVQRGMFASANVA